MYFKIINIFAHIYPILINVLIWQTAKHNRNQPNNFNSVLHLFLVLSLSPLFLTAENEIIGSDCME